MVHNLLTERGLMLKSGTIVDATLIAAPSSTKNARRERDPEMHQTKKGNQWYFGMKAHVGVDAETGLVHTVVATAANVSDVTQAHRLLHGQETDVFADAGYQGVDKRAENQGKQVAWHVAMRPGKRRALDKRTFLGQVMDALERTKARIRAKGEHPFRVLKCQFGYRKTPYRGLAKNGAQLNVLFALVNLWLARKALLAAPDGISAPAVGSLGPDEAAEGPRRGLLEPKNRSASVSIPSYETILTLNSSPRTSGRGSAEVP
ncbi:Transposase DDE domain [Tepidiphilus thermophilus]|uniref:Transposase DDE domain n=1 Tax=Tepidiphilus thermophilus TaxID=876478 RepID=A0A0K6IYK4_9PROT|nr:Transposase DDE domain [Tepidiphilus thermophilus]